MPMRSRRRRARNTMRFQLQAVVATGTTPPAMTLTGVPNSGYSFNLQITTGGALGVAVFKWSSDGGLTFTSNVTTAATTVLGSTGITANWPAGTYATDNIYTATEIAS